jgi:hypothetical protein
MPSLPYSFRTLTEAADYFDQRAEEKEAQLRVNRDDKSNRLCRDRIAGAAHEARVLADMLRHTQFTGEKA